MHTHSNEADRFLGSIHLLNAAWIGRVFFIYLGSNRIEINFLADPLLVVLLVSTCMVHVVRWRHVFRAPIERTFTSSIELGKAMRGAGELAYKRIPYQPAPLPNDMFIMTQAKTALSRSSEVHVSVLGDLFGHLLRSDRLVGIHLFMTALVLGFLFSAGLPSFATSLRAIPFAIPLLTCVGAGIGIYTVSTLIYLALPARISGASK